MVDDERSVRVSLLRILRATGYDAVGAGSGQEALAKALEWHPDVVLMDLMMPLENGMDTARKMRSHAPLACIPIIALTASSLSVETQSFFQLVLTKPCLSVDLLSAIANVTRQ